MKNLRHRVEGFLFSQIRGFFLVFPIVKKYVDYLKRINGKLMHTINP